LYQHSPRNVLTADAQGRGSNQESEIVKADQLAAIVAQLEGDPDQSAAAYDFYRNTGIAIERFQGVIDELTSKQKTLSKKGV